MRRNLAVILAAVSVLTTSAPAFAQEIQLTGPLAGAPAVRELRYHRLKRWEVAPVLSFTLLDEYQRTILVGARVTYNMYDWLGVGAWGAYGVVHSPTSLSEQIQDQTQARREADPSGNSVDSFLTKGSVGATFKDQLGSIDYVFAPQITAVPFRGKLAIFQKVFLDTDAYFFAGPAFVGLSERGNCKGNCTEPSSFAKSSRTAVAPTFGLGLSFYSGSAMSFGIEWRALPFAWNTGGFDTRGGAPDGKFPDRAIDDQDRTFRFNQVLSLSAGFAFPKELKSSD